MPLTEVFEIGPYFRAENSHTVRHLSEFTSVDIEASFLDYQDVMDIIEKVIRKVVTELHENYKRRPPGSWGKGNFGYKD